MTPAHPFGLLCLANNTCIADTFIALEERFNRLYRARAHIHHYTGVSPLACFAWQLAASSLV